MKIALSTLFTSLSPGAIWQTVALIETLKSFNQDVDVVSKWTYKTDYSLDKHFSKKFKNRYRGISYCNNTVNYVITNYGYKTVKGFNDESLCDYQAIIIGSDQTFNYNQFSDYFFVPNMKTICKYSFASSFGYTRVDKDLPIELLNGFRKISIREKNDSDELNKYGIKTNYHIDPIFLLDRNKWLSFKSNKSKTCRGDYVLLFGVCKPLNTLVFAKKLAKRKKCKLIVTNYWGNNPLIGKKIMNFDNVMDLLPLIANAKYVVTHSYHGFIFSLLFNVDVYYSSDKSLHSDERFRSVVDILSLPTRNIFYPDEIEENPYEWNNINQRIEIEKKRSFSYLKEIINDE